MWEFISANWIWILLIGGMVFMHLGHGGHGGQGGQADQRGHAGNSGCGHGRHSEAQTQVPEEQQPEDHRHRPTG